MRGTKHTFVANLLAGTNFTVVNGVGMLKLPNSRVAKLELLAQRVSEQYDSLRLTIINKDDGKVDSNMFLFSELLEADKNNKHPNADFKSCRVIAHTGWDWYIDYPTKQSLEKLKSTIDDYLSFLA